MYSGSPWVIPSFLCKKWPNLFVVFIYKEQNTLHYIEYRKSKIITKIKTLCVIFLYRKRHIICVILFEFWNWGRGGGDYLQKSRNFAWNYWRNIYIYIYVTNTNKCIIMMDPQTGNIFLFISCVGFSCCNAFILCMFVFPYVSHSLCMSVSLSLSLYVQSSALRPSKCVSIYFLVFHSVVSLFIDWTDIYIYKNTYNFALCDRTKICFVI